MGILVFSKNGGKIISHQVLFAMWVIITTIFQFADLQMRGGLPL